MIVHQGDFVQSLLAPGTVASGATTSARISRAFYDYAIIDLIFPAATATNSSAKWGVISIGEDDTTAVSNATNIVAFVGTTNSVTSATAGFVIPAQNDTTNPQILRMMVDCRGRKKNLFLTVQSASSHSTVAAVVTLTRPEQLAAIDSKRGVNIVTVIG
jgi:hypothetical protein